MSTKLRSNVTHRYSELSRCDARFVKSRDPLRTLLHVELWTSVVFTFVLQTRVEVIFSSLLPNTVML